MSGRTWICAVCGTRGKWTRSWKRWSSLAADESCQHDVPTCSDECRDKAKPLILVYERTHGAGGCA